jgi:hypothetical protein
LCALSALCAISPLSLVGRDGKTASFPAINHNLPRGQGRCPVMLWHQVVKELFIVRGRLGALLLITRSISSLRGLRRQAKKHRPERVVLVLLAMGSLRWPRRDATGSALSTRAFCKLVAAARKEQFGAKPGSAVAFRRRWQVNSYFHISTVFRKRREALRIYFTIGAGTRQSGRNFLVENP